MKKTLLILISILLVGLIYIFIDYKVYINVNVHNNKLEINTKYVISDLVKNVYNASLINGDDKVLFNELGNKKIVVSLKNKFGKVYRKEIDVEIVDTVAPDIKCEDINTYIYEDIDYLNYVEVSDNSLEKIVPLVISSYDDMGVGEYNVKYVAKDTSGNKSECSVKLYVKDKIVMNNNLKEYYLKLNRKLNVLMIYGIDNNGNYNKLVKTFVVSAGNDTPIGTFTVKERYDYISFTGGSYGRYGVRITGPYWFHSVPYNGKARNGHWDNVSYNEYNKLGSLASHGCIRLAVSDVKWIYDNVGKGSIVDIYDSDELSKGVVKPSAVKIDVNSPNRGWDPTDIDTDNPWKK